MQHLPHRAPGPCEAIGLPQGGPRLRSGRRRLLGLVSPTFATRRRPIPRPPSSPSRGHRVPLSVAGHLPHRRRRRGDPPMVDVPPCPPSPSSSAHHPGRGGDHRPDPGRRRGVGLPHRRRNPGRRSDEGAAPRGLIRGHLRYLFLRPFDSKESRPNQEPSDPGRRRPPSPREGWVVGPNHRLIGSSASTPSIPRRLRSTRTRPPRSPIPSSWPPPLLAFDSSRVPRHDYIRRPDFHSGTPASRPCVAGARHHIPCTGAVPPMVGLDFPAPGSWAGRTREVRWTRPYSFRLGMSRTPWKPGIPRRQAGELQLQSIRQASIFIAGVFQVGKV